MMTNFWCSLYMGVVLVLLHARVNNTYARYLNWTYLVIFYRNQSDMNLLPEKRCTCLMLMPMVIFVGYIKSTLISENPPVIYDIWIELHHTALKCARKATVIRLFDSLSDKRHKLSIIKSCTFRHINYLWSTLCSVYYLTEAEWGIYAFKLTVIG